MEKIQTLEYKDTQKLASAINTGKEFFITSGKQKYIAYPYDVDIEFTSQEQAEIDKALIQSDKDFASDNVFSHDEVMGQLDAVIAKYK